MSAAQGIVNRDHARAKAHVRRCASAANAARQSLREACKCLDRAQRALRLVEGQEGEPATEVEFAAATVKRAHRECEVAAKTAGAMARRGDVRGAERAASDADRAQREANTQATAAGRAARAKR